jgi:hypothetical protein
VIRTSFGIVRIPSKQLKSILKKYNVNYKQVLEKNGYSYDYNNILNKNACIYICVNLINGKIFIGSAKKGYFFNQYYAHINIEKYQG